MKKCLFLLSSLAVSSVAIAQTNFQPGYVVPLSGDTLRGEVDSRGELRGATLCRFRASAQADATEYKPGEIRGYGFDAGNSYRTAMLPNAARTPAFLQVLADGKLTLLRYTNENENKQYYAQTASAPLLQPLIQRDTIVLQINPQTQAENRVSTRVYPFRNVLWQLMADCPTVQTSLTRLELQEARLVKTVTAYNTCVGGPQYVIRKQTNKVRVGVFAGVYRANVTYKDDKQYFDLTSDALPSFGLALHLKPASFNPHLSLLAELWFTRQKYSTTYDGVGPLGPGYERTLKVDIASIGVPLLLRYSLTKGIVRPYVQAGFVFKQNIKNEAEKSDYLPRFSSDRTTTAIDLKSYNIGGLFGVGVTIPTGSKGSINLEGRLDKLDSTSSAAGIISNSRGLSLLAGYTFGQ
ncbi:porin family protein [Hymenobacter metallilatus]|nr:porin family protein [Hymenobacter metallilatus]